MKIELSAEELHILVTAIKAITIKGEDAVRVGQLITRLEKAFGKQAEKEGVQY